jgi:tetratricopeptide (TPR) repeat protein
MPADKFSKFAYEAKPSSTNYTPLQPLLGEAEISTQNREILLQIASLIRLAEGFRLGFVKCNQPVQCRQMTTKLREMLADEAIIISVELNCQVSSLRRAILQALESSKSEYAGKSAILVFGFEHSVPSEGPAPALDELNQSRDNFPKSFSCPVLIWLPDYALTRLAREAPDFWGWRSGVFELAPELGVIAAVEKMAIVDSFSDGLDLSEKMKKTSALEGLIRDYQDLPRGERRDRSLAAVLQSLGYIRYLLGEYDEAQHLYQESLKISQDLGDNGGVSGSLHQLGNLAYVTGDLTEARQLYQESLKISQDLGDKSGVSKSLHQLGNLAYVTGDLGEARRLYQDGLKISQDLGDKSGVSKSLGQLGNLAYVTGDLAEARRLYQESLKISRDLGDKSGVSKSLHQMGILAQDTGEYDEARQIYQQSMKIFQDLGDKIGVSRSLHQLGNLAYDTGDLAEARRLYQESLKISQDLGDKIGVSKSVGQLGNLAYVTGDLGEARRHYLDSLKIFQELGDKSGISLTLAQLSLLEEMEGNLDKALELIRQAESLFIELGSTMAAQAQAQRQRLENKINKVQ